MPIPGGLTHVLQPLDVSINKLLKQRITQIYCDICIKLGRIIEKIKREVIIDWILQIWKYEQNTINKEMIYMSFKYCDISNSLDGNKNSLIKVYDKINEEIDEIDENKDIKEEFDIEKEDSIDSKSEEED